MSELSQRPGMQRPGVQRPGVAWPARTRWLVALASAVALPLVGLALRGVTAEMGFMRAVSEQRHGWLEALTLGVYRALEPLYATGLMVLVAVVVGCCLRSVRGGVWFALSVGLTWLPIWLVKFAIQRPRPDASVLANPLLPTPSDPSFPSGHTAFATILVVMVGLVVVSRPGRTKWQPGRQSAWRWVWRVGGPCLVVLVAGTVVIAGVHYPSDALTSVVWSVVATPVVAALVARAVAPAMLLRR